MLFLEENDENLMKKKMFFRRIHELNGDPQNLHFFFYFFSLVVGSNFHQVGYLVQNGRCCWLILIENEISWVDEVVENVFEHLPGWYDGMLMMTWGE